jgi:hypothetical protein
LEMGPHPWERSNSTNSIQTPASSAPPPPAQHTT